MCSVNNSFNITLQYEKNVNFIVFVNSEYNVTNNWVPTHFRITMENMTFLMKEIVKTGSSFIFS